MEPTLTNISISILILSFILNLLWEIPHSYLYKTTLKMPWKSKLPLLTKMSFRDSIEITAFYLLTFLIFKNVDITQNTPQLATFVIFALLFSFFDEKISLKMKRWTYDSKMPLLFGVGLAPLLELAITGLLTFLILFKFIL